MLNIIVSDLKNNNEHPQQEEDPDHNSEKITPESVRKDRLKTKIREYKSCLNNCGEFLNEENINSIQSQIDSLTQELES